VCSAQRARDMTFDGCRRCKTPHQFIDQSRTVV
jgi:hypothetical protein